MQANEIQNQRYMETKKIVMEIMEIITTKDSKTIKEFLSKKSQELNKMKDFENISEKDLINEFKEGRGRNSIHFAAGRGDWKVLESLLEMGGNLESKDEEGNSVLMVAIQHNHKELVKEILQRNPKLLEEARKGNVYPVHLAATGGKKEILEILIENKCNLKVQSDELGSVVEWAVIHQDLDSLCILLKHNCSVLKNNQTKMPPPFILALDSDNMSIIDTIYNHDPSVIHETDPEGYTAVHLVSEQGKLHLLQYLHQRNADLYVVNKGLNAIDLAFQNNHYHIISYLNQLTNNTLQQSELSKQQLLQQQSSSKPKIITEEDKQKALELKEEGNKLFSQDEYSKAIEKYTSAFEYDNQNIQVLTNRAACFINLKEYEKALNDCKIARTISLEWSKTFFREGEAYFHLNQYPDSAASFWEALKLEPNNKAYKFGFDRSVKIGKSYYQKQ